MHTPEEQPISFKKDAEWERLLDSETRDWVESMRKDLFDDLYDQGFRVVYSVFQDTGRVLLGGPRAIWQKREAEVACEEIARLLKEDEYTGIYHEYAWRSPAIGPHSDWKTKSILRAADIKIQSAGVTIFAKSITSPA